MDTSLSTSNGSPDPPDIASHGVTEDEDSQESLTLLNALDPLPDTQRDSPEHNLSSPPERDGALQLLSRPQTLDIDPGESFSWGKPVKITPGQFSRPVPAKSMVDATKEKTITTSPSVVGSLGVGPSTSTASGSVQTVSVASGQHGNTTFPDLRRLSGEEPSHIALASAKSSLLPIENHQSAANDSENLNRVRKLMRRPPFEDYQPQYRRQEGKDQLSVTHTSPVQRLAQPGDAGAVQRQPDGPTHHKGEDPRREQAFSEQGNGDYHSVDERLKQQNHSASAAQINKQSHRISFANDTSVSPSQMPQRSIQAASQHQTPRERLVQRNTPADSPHPSINRPLRDVRRLSHTKTPTHCPSSRSSVHGSNISKKRSRPRPSLSGRARPSRQPSSRYHDDTPSMRRRDRHPATNNRDSSLGNSQHSNESPEIDVFAGNLAQALNSNFEMMKQGWKRKDQELAYLERHLEKTEGELSNFKRQSEGKAGRIQELEDDRIRLQEQLESANQKLEDRSTRLSKLEEKCRTYKDYLNEATAEQQELYTAAKTKCENAIKQMREEERKRKALDEQGRKDLQATRERLTQVVKSTVAEYSFKERNFNDKIESLNQRMQERDADLDRERETIRNLVEQNATVASVQGVLKSFESQIEQISAKMGEVASSQVERDAKATEETQAKLDKIAAHISALDERVEPQASIIERLQEANVQAFSTILKPVLNSHTEAQTNLQKLSDAVEDYMEDFWMKLEDREDVLTELLEQTKADNAQLEVELQLRADERNDLLTSLEQARATLQQREKDLVDLKDEVAELEQAQADDLGHAARANSLLEECDKLKVDVAAKATIARGLEYRLQQSQAALLEETQKHERHTQELRKLMEQSEEAARTAQETAVEIARQEVIRDTDLAKERIDTLLKKAETESNSLKKELNAAKQQISTVEEANRRDSATVDELRAELETAQAETTRLGGEASEKDKEIQEAFDRNAKHIQDLQEKIARKEREFSQLSEDAQKYDKQVHKVLDSLKTWANGRQAIKGFVSELEKAQNGDLDNVDPKLRPFLEIDVLHRAIFQYCLAQGQSAQDGERDTADESNTDKDIWADLPPSSPPERITPVNLAARVLDQVLSAEQERRRSANPPKSIMKSGSQGSILGNEDLAEPRMPAQSFSVPSRGSFGRRAYMPPDNKDIARQQDDEPRQEELQERTSSVRSNFSRASYNRPVSGINPQPDSGITRHGTRFGRELQKRKQADQQKAESPSKRTKKKSDEEESVLQKHHSSPPERQVNQGNEFPVAPSAPRKRSRKNTNLLRDSISPVRSLHFTQNVPSREIETPVLRRNDIGARDVTLSGLKALLASKTKMDSQDSSQDPQSLYYQRRRSSQQNEDSQDSITHSQGVRGDLVGPPIRTRRFTMGP
ncbi:hypothetical protein J7T55_004408 [Diaporthe amygdali]|uniref:uncharacterized protein n=1 Tax=Phomopsis amygdali TaxID=1214568 RepID=UPI0022FE4678|nr:uncharacterized protein J7T55_004408 [Diaporthe amygdali]KAJ0109858.1 hypothetical protein J7T55_004408 [Diaporthe amygdali]